MKLTCPNRCRIFFSRGMYIYLGISILLIPIRLFIAMCISAIVHELFHILAMKLCGIPVYSVRISPLGAAIHAQMMTQFQELICSLAGPLGALTLLLFAKRIPLIALCAFFQTIYNLIPVYPFDGGRALRCLFHLILPQCAAEVLFAAVEKLTFGVIIVAAIYVVFHYRLGILPILLAAFPLLENKNSLQR